MAVFSLRFVSSSDGTSFTDATSFTEGQTNLGFIISWDGAVAAGTVISWEIIFAGRLPLTASDFDFSTNPQSGTLSVPVSTEAGESAVIPFTLVNDAISEPVQDLVVRLSIGTNTGSHTLSATTYTAPVADDDLASTTPYQLAGTVPQKLVGGNANANIFTAGETASSRIEGGDANDQYIITRYQTSSVSIGDAAGNDVIRFDFGVEIQSARTSGFGGANGIITLANGNRIVLSIPNQPRWSFQLGDGEAMSWADFLTAVSGGYTVSSYLDSTTLGEGGPTGTNIYGGTSSRDDVFAIGEDAPSRIGGLGGNDTYIISRFQNRAVEIIDSVGDDVIKFDVGVSISSLAPFEDVDAVITLTNGARVTVDDHTRFQYQIADGELMNWTDFLALAGSGYTVPGLPNRPPIGADDIILVNAGGSHTFEADDFGYRDQNYDPLTHVTIISLPKNAIGATTGTLELGSDTNDDDVIDTYTPVTLNQKILAADIPNLRYTAGTADASFEFKVHGGGADSVDENTITFNVNNLPTAADNIITINPNAAHVFAADDFGYADADNDALVSIIIVELPGAGTLRLGSDSDHDAETTYKPITMGQTIAAADIAKLRYTATAGADSFTFKVNDGTSDSAVANKMTFTINTAPTLANALVDYTQAIVKGAIHTYQLPSDSFTDVDGDILTYKAAQLDSAGNEIALPIGLSFDAATNTFTFTDALAFSTYTIKVTAADGLASVADEFDLRIVDSASIVISDKAGTELDDSDLPPPQFDIT